MNILRANKAFCIFVAFLLVVEALSFLVFDAQFAAINATAVLLGYLLGYNLPRWRNRRPPPPGNTSM